MRIWCLGASVGTADLLRFPAERAGRAIDSLDVIAWAPRQIEKG